MAKKKWRLNNLFEDTDSNIPVTIFSETFNKNTYYYYRANWFTAIKDGLDNLALCPESTYHFQITSINGKVQIIHSTCNKLIDELHTLFSCKQPTSLRIDILENSDLSWIIILKEDL